MCRGHCGPGPPSPEINPFGWCLEGRLLIVWTLLPHHPCCLCASTGSSQLWHPAPASSPTLSSLFACSLLLPQVAVSPAGQIAPNLTSFSAYFVLLLCLNHSLSTTIEAYPVCLSLITLCQTGSREMIGMPNCVAAVGSWKKSTLNFHWEKAIKVVMHCMDRLVSHSLTYIHTNMLRSSSEWHPTQSQTIQHCCWIFILKTPPVPTRMSIFRCVRERCVCDLLYK